MQHEALAARMGICETPKEQNAPGWVTEKKMSAEELMKMQTLNPFKKIQIRKLAALGAAASAIMLLLSGCVHHLLPPYF